MGAWGGGIFESDADCDIVSELEHELGIDYDYESETPKSPQEKRARLDDGHFDRVFAKQQGSKEPYPLSLTSVVDGSYMCILLMVVAMKVGAKVSDAQRAYVRSNYKKAGLMLEGIEQIGRALDEYTSGTPYELVDPDKTQYDADQKREKEYAEKTGRGYVMMNHFGARYHAENTPTPDFMQVMQQKKSQQQGPGGPAFPFTQPSGNAPPPASDVSSCNACGKAESALGHDLKRCSKCKMAQYCDRECQKKGYKVHKKVCAGLTANGAA